MTHLERSCASRSLPSQSRFCLGPSLRSRYDLVLVLAERARFQAGGLDVPERERPKRSEGKPDGLGPGLDTGRKIVVHWAVQRLEELGWPEAADQVSWAASAVGGWRVSQVVQASRGGPAFGLSPHRDVADEMTTGA